MQHFVGDPESGRLYLENQCLTPDTAKKTLDENQFKNAQKTTDTKPPPFQLGDSIYFKNKQPQKWDLKWKPRYRIVHTEDDRHYLHIENQAT